MDKEIFEINEIDAKEMENMFALESELSWQLIILNRRRKNAWERLASQFNFDLKKDLAEFNSETNTISISRFNKKEE